MCTYNNMIMDVELFLQVLAFLDQLTPQEQRRLMEMSQLDSQLTKVERVQLRMASSLVSLCVHAGLSLLRPFHTRPKNQIQCASNAHSSRSH